MDRANKKMMVGVAVIAVIIAGGLLFKKITGSPDQQPQPSTTNNGPLSFLKLPEDFVVHAFAKYLEKPRVLILDSAGNMLVSETEKGTVLLLKDEDKDGSAETKKTILSGLKKPHGLAVYTDDHETYLYVAETHQVSRYRYNSTSGTVTSGSREHITSLPADGGHFTRTIAFGPNYRTGSLVGGLGLSPIKLYISVGSSCDVCVEEATWKRATILESDPAGTYTAEFAGGLRNSVFFAFHPKTKEIWATEMGRDNLGDNVPPDEVNIVKVAGSEHEFGARRYGWPFCYGNRIADRTFKPAVIARKDLSSDCAKTDPPVIELPAHSAPLGLAFIPSGQGWPAKWAGDLLVAFHGSWNRTEKTGYTVVRYDLDADGNVLSQKPNDFISGWLEGDDVLGRPVDLKFGPNGELYISDDRAGIIYAVSPK